jgi:hypothetical protein
MQPPLCGVSPRRHPRRNARFSMRTRRFMELKTDFYQEYSHPVDWNFEQFP